MIILLIWILSGIAIAAIYEYRLLKEVTIGSIFVGGLLGGVLLSILLLCWYVIFPGMYYLMEKMSEIKIIR